MTKSTTAASKGAASRYYSVVYEYVKAVEAARRAQSPHDYAQSARRIMGRDLTIREARSLRDELAPTMGLENLTVQYRKKGS